MRRVSIVSYKHGQEQIRLHKPSQMFKNATYKSECKAKDMQSSHDNSNISNTQIKIVPEILLTK